MRGIPLLDVVSSILNGDQLPPGGRDEPVSRAPCPRACGGEASDVERDVFVGGGVAAAVPGHSVILDADVESGTPTYWVRGIRANASTFNACKTTMDNNKFKFESITLQSETLSFLPDGDVYGLGVEDADKYMDAGLQLEIREQRGQQTACFSELALLLTAARRGVAPAVVAAFFDSAVVGSPPLVIVSQLSTFSFGTMLEHYTEAPAGAKREHVRQAISTALPLVCAKLRELSNEDMCLVKLNMSANNVVFCPSLEESSSGWNLNGVGFSPVSNSMLDGLPFLVDFSPTWTCSLRSDAHSPQLSLVMHSMLLTAFARSEHGAAASGVIWETLLDKGDPTGFLKSLDELQSSDTNASAYLAAMAATAELRETPEVSKAISDVVCDLDNIVRKRVTVKAGKLEADPKSRLFTKLVSLASGLADPDTAVFATDEASELLAEAEQLAAMRAVKMARRRRLAAS